MTMTFRRTAWRLLAVFLVVLTTMTALFAFGVPKTAEAAKTFTVYLQAGHSPSSLGNGNIQGGIKESLLNEQLTKKTYEAIRNAGISVKLLNPISIDSSLPSLIKDPPGEKAQYAYYSPEPAMLTALTWPSRFDPAVTEQGDLVLSLHHNAYVDTSIRGYEVYYAKSYGGDYGRTAGAAAKSQQAATLVGQALSRASFGIPPRNPAVRENSNHNGLTKNSPVPCVLLESGYMSNASDLAAARNETNQKKIAQQLAEAVVSYRDTVWGGGTATPQPPAEMDAKGFSAQPITGPEEGFAIRVVFRDPSIVQGASVGVFPQAAGQDAMKMYPLTKAADGAYTGNVSLKDFGSEAGRYAFRLYGTDLTGQNKYLEVIYSEFVRAPQPTATPAPTTQVVTADSISVAKAFDTATSVTLQAVNVKSTGGSVTGVRFAVWSREGGQDDLKWYPASASGSNWSVRISNADHLGRTGAYITHVYATDSGGGDTLVGFSNFMLGEPSVASDTEAPVMNGSITANLRTKTDLTVKATKVVDPAGVENVRFAFWGQADQGDLEWYNGVQDGNDWTVEISLMNHPSLYGGYTVHAYATDRFGNDGLLGGEKLRLGSDIEPPTAGRISAEIISSGTNLAMLRAEEVTDSDSGVESVRFDVWTEKDGKDDLIHYEAEPAKDEGVWDVMITGQKHHDEKGPYMVEAWGTDKAGNSGKLGSTVFTFESGDTTPPKAEGMTTNADVYTMPRADITVQKVTDDTGVASVRVAVWNEEAGKDSLQWYTAKKSGLNWIVSLDWAVDFASYGRFTIEAFATDYAGNEASVAKCRVEVKQSVIGGYPIMGKTEATTAQLVNFMLRYGWDDSWYDMRVDEFCQIYMDVCAAEGVRAEVAFAQMVHETGGLKYGNLVQRSQYNFAGLGASGLVVAESSRKPNHAYTEDGRDCGIQFASVENGIKSHVQHLKGYASKEPLKLEMAPEYDRYGYMELGCAPTVEALSGKWATSESYALKIMLFVESILGESKQMQTVTGGDSSGSVLSRSLTEDLIEINAHDE